MSGRGKGKILHICPQVYYNIIQTVCFSLCAEREVREDGIVCHAGQDGTKAGGDGTSAFGFISGM